MQKGTGAVWQPDAAVVAGANLTKAIRDRGMSGYEEFYEWSITDRSGFWQDVIERLGIALRVPPAEILASPHDVEASGWFTGARLNIAESCFGRDESSVAIVYSDAGRVRTLSLGELHHRVVRAASGLASFGIEAGDRVAIAMPMNVEAVTAYLAVIWRGGVVVSIADSFAADEVRTRLEIAGASTVITQDVTRRGGTTYPMYEKVVAAGAERAIVVDTGAGMALRGSDIAWSGLAEGEGEPEAAEADAAGFINILFSSGTTGDPKAIPWTHLSPIKAAMDGHYHQDIHPGDVVAWPTNLGWMMGPWLIFASLINGAAIALYDGAPMESGFGRFVEEAGVTMLGVVPSLVAAWRASGAVEAYDWSSVRVLTSTGEASNPSDMAYLMDLAGNKPVIEYCGGTEIAGGYITGTVLQPGVPAQFTTPALGIDVRILDEDNNAAASGELFLVPPSIGMSEILLNRDHHEVYFAGTPRLDGVPLRRHGDHLEELEGGYYRAHGRVDDTMNLGGIKVSSGEIERVVAALADVSEAAAIAVSPAGGGPSSLVVFAVVLDRVSTDPADLKLRMQAEIRMHLNPLFKVHDVVVIDGLPRTASNKVMRRVLRDRLAG